jgi:DNA-binding transcriptional regulator YiaG
MNPTPAQLKSLRIGAGLTQPDAAALIHVTKRTLQDWEHDVNDMHLGLWELLTLKISSGAREPALIESPTADQLIHARLLDARMSQPVAARLIHSTKRTWQDWECGKARMPPGLWELFLIKIQVPTKRKYTKAKKPECTSGNRLTA